MRKDVIMSTKAGLLLSACIALLGGTCGLSQAQEWNSADVLEHYRASLSYLESVSMKIAINVDSNDSHLFPQTLDFVFRGDMQTNRAEWLGRQLIYKEGGELDTIESRSIKDIADGHIYVSLEGDRFADEIPSQRVILFNNYKERLKDLMENPNYGGALFGKMYGSSYRSVADLLSESSDFHMHNSKEYIDGVTCVVLEGTSKYGKVTAWIAPEKGYNALKWTIEKTPHHLFDNAPIKSNHWQVSFNVQEFHEVISNGKTTFVPKLAQFTHSIDLRKGPKNIDHYEYETSDIELEPDFEALVAFKIDFPDGIRVFNRDFPNVKFIWEKGKPVPFLDQSALDSIDYQIQQMNNANKTKSTREIKNTKDILYESTPVVNTQPETQKNIVDAQEVLSESHSLTLLVLVPIGLLIIAVLGWMVFRRIKA